MRHATVECLNPYSIGRYSQRPRQVCYPNCMPMHVLILILLEDTLRDARDACKGAMLSVLILILLEDTLREYVEVELLLMRESLNPYSIGRYSQRGKTILPKVQEMQS